MTKEEKDLAKHLLVAKLIKTIAKATGNKTSAKTLSKIIKEKLGLYYSPKHLYYLIRQNKMSGVTLRIFPYLKYGKYYKKPHKIGKKIIATRIDQRDEIINKRIRYGDVEVDTVEGTKTDNKYLSTMIDRKSRRLSITIYENKQSNEFFKAVENNIKNMNQEIKSITSDNGTENYDLVKLNIPWFSTNPYSSWQKGTIEQKHKQIRKFIPKGKSFKNLTQDDCDLIALVINAENYLQNTKKYKLGTTVTQEELQKYFKLLEKKDTHRIFQLW
ncbi:IS30 family transposase [Metamycoplasma sualvi]|uniref:IS30 family transposase n=1 Tax=Metamycoplasma sualvi TaxID=2125 RepID=UPI003873335E